MKSYIGENIKRLRKEKNITQDVLSRHLSISCQAISKWERGETFPDITLVVPIASYFGVSTDELLGVDYSKNEQKIQDCLAEFDRLSNEGREKEKCDLIRKAYIEFPNDFRIIDKHLLMLAYDPYIEKYDKHPGIPAHLEEMTMLCNRVIDECTIPDFRYGALSILVDIHEYNGNREKALETIELFPDSLYWSKGAQYECFYSEENTEWQYWVRYNINDLSQSLIYRMRNCVLSSPLSPQERIGQFHAVVDLIKLLYEDGDYGFAHYHLCELYLYISDRYIELGNYDKAAEFLDRGLSHGKCYDELPDTTVHTSFIIRGYEFNARKVYSGFKGNEIMRELDIIDTREFYEKARDTSRYKAVLNKYRPYAKADKD